MYEEGAAIYHVAGVMALYCRSATDYAPTTPRRTRSTLLDWFARARWISLSSSVNRVPATSTVSERDLSSTGRALYHHHHHHYHHQQ